MRAPLLLALLLSGIATGSFVPASAAATSPGLAGLEQQLNMLIAGRSGEYGIAALDLRDGSTVAVNGDTPFPMASTVKLAIAAAYLAQVDQGRRSLGEMIAGRSAATVLELMIVHSDNQAADQLLAAVGGPIIRYGVKKISVQRALQPFIYLLFIEQMRSKCPQGHQSSRKIARSDTPQHIARIIRWALHSLGLLTIMAGLSRAPCSSKPPFRFPPFFSSRCL